MIKTTRSVIFSRKSPHWATPRETFAALHREFHFTMDPCPLHGETAGPLFRPWTNERVFVNPPYGKKIITWLNRWVEAELAVFLLPVRTDTKWFHEIVLPMADEIRFARGRINFNDGPHNAPLPSMIVIFRNE